MKKALSLLSLAALTIGLLGSCSKINERIDGVEKRVESIENEKIASIENQIAAINSSIADLGQIRSDISSLKQSAVNHGQDISELQEADETLKNRIDNLKDYLDGTLTKYAEKDWAIATFATLEQLNATKTSLSALEGKVNKLGETFDGKLSDLKTELTNSINTAVSNLETRISTLEDRVSALEAMIQSVSITPTYSDGSVEADEDSILTLKCIVKPAEALTRMQSLKDSLVIYADSVKVKTKAGTSAYMEIKVSEAAVTDAAQGAITLKANISEYLPKGEDKALTVALHIKNGISDFTTEFVPVSVAGPDIPEGALSGVFSVSADKKVRFSQGNLQATYNGSGYTFGFAANQYDYIGDAAGNTTIDSQTYGAVVDLFCWSTDAVSNNWGIHTKEGTNVEGFTTGNFKDWGKVFDDKGTWRTLTKEEWGYLITNHSKKWVAVNGVNGYVIAPDGFTGTLLDKYADDTALAAENLVFLPAASYRQGSGIPYWAPGSGRYWTTSNYNFVSFAEYAIQTYQDSSKTYGYSVRLVTEVK